MTIWKVLIQIQIWSIPWHQIQTHCNGFFSCTQRSFYVRRSLPACVHIFYFMPTEASSVLGVPVLFFGAPIQKTSLSLWRIKGRAQEEACLIWACGRSEWDCTASSSRAVPGLSNGLQGWRERCLTIPLESNYFWHFSETMSEVELKCFTSLERYQLSFTELSPKR